MEHQDAHESAQPSSAQPFLGTHFVTAADEIETLAFYGPSLILVLGEAGIGKSCQFEHIQSHCDDLKQIRVDANPMLSTEQLLASILAQLGALEQRVEFETTRKSLADAATLKPIAILVDDAQHLSAEVLSNLLAMVAPLMQSPQRDVRLVLFGTPELPQLIVAAVSSELSTDAMSQVVLQGLAKDEVNGFLAYTLHLPQARVAEDYGERRFRKLWQQSRGNPKRLLEILHQPERFAEEPLPEEKPKQPRLFRGILLLLGVTLVLVAVFSDLWWPFVQAPLSPHAGVPLPFTAKISAPPSPSRLAGATPVTPPAPVEQAATKPLAGFKTGRESRVLQQKNTPLATLAETRTTTPAAATNGAKARPPTVAVPHTLAPVQPQTTAKVTQGGSPARAKNTPQKPKKHQLSAPASRNYTAAERWILSRPQSHYAIQLVGLSQRDEMALFARRLKLTQLRYYRSRLNQRPWFILLYGDFSTAIKARAARDKLPPRVARLKPWIKSFAVIQQQIRTAVH